MKNQNTIKMINELVKMSVIKVWASLLTICTLEYFFPFFSSYASPWNDSSLLSPEDFSRTWSKHAFATFSWKFYGISQSEKKSEVKQPIRSIARGINMKKTKFLLTIKNRVCYQGSTDGLLGPCFWHRSVRNQTVMKRSYTVVSEFEIKY